MLYELLYSIATLKFILDKLNYICHGKFLAVHLIPINCQLLTAITSDVLHFFLPPFPYTQSTNLELKKEMPYRTLISFYSKFISPSSLFTLKEENTKHRILYNITSFYLETMVITLSAQTADDTKITPEKPTVYITTTGTKSHSSSLIL